MPKSKFDKEVNNKLWVEDFFAKLDKKAKSSEDNTVEKYTVEEINEIGVGRVKKKKSPFSVKLNESSYGKLRQKNAVDFIKVGVRKISPKGLNKISKNNSFVEFKWQEVSDDIFALVLPNGDVVGLMSLFFNDMFNAIEISKIEVAENERGGNRRYFDISACFIALAVQAAFVRNLNGKVILISLKIRKDYYINKYGFEKDDIFLKIEGDESKKVVDNIYFKIRIPPIPTFQITIQVNNHNNRTFAAI